MGPTLLERLLPRHCCGAPPLGRLEEELRVDDPAGLPAPRAAAPPGRPQDDGEEPDAGPPPAGRAGLNQALAGPDQASACHEADQASTCHAPQRSPRGRLDTAASTDLPSPDNSPRGLDTCCHKLPSSASVAAAPPEEEAPASAAPVPEPLPSPPADEEAPAAAGGVDPPGAGKAARRVSLAGGPPPRGGGGAGDAQQSPRASWRSRARTAPKPDPPGEDASSPRGSAVRKRHSHKVTVHKIGSDMATRVGHLRGLTRRRSSGIKEGKIVAPQGVKPIFEKVVDATIDDIQATLLRTEQCPMARFLSEILGCYDIEPAEWKPDPTEAGTMVLKRRYSAPVPENVPDAVAKIVRLPPVIGTTTVYRLRRSEPGEVTLVQQSYTGDVLYGDRFKIQNTISFKEDASEVVCRQWADIVWTEPLPWHSSLIRHFIEKRSRADAIRYAPQLLCMIEDAVQAS